MQFKSKWVLWTARVEWPHRPFRFPTGCWEPWVRLRNLFPDSLGAVLMPDHVHLILKALTHAQDLKRLRHFCGWASQQPGFSGRWKPIESPKEISDRKHLLRMVRYVPLNPCRAKITDDPFYWPWTTLRGTFGSVANPWVRLDKIREELGWKGPPFARAFFEYVVTDKDVSLESRVSLISARKSEIPATSLEDIFLASTLALERDPQLLLKRRHLSRALAVQLAHATGWRLNRSLAQRMRVSPAAVTYLGRRRLPTGALEAALLNLGDSRLRRALIEPLQSTPRRP